MISEIIREKVLTHTKEEVPHSINVIVETMEQTSKQKLHIQATIITERESQKGILIGKKGHMLKKIGQEARSEERRVGKEGGARKAQMDRKEKRRWRSAHDRLR